jgi:hypothetical protein
MPATLAACGVTAGRPREAHPRSDAERREQQAIQDAIERRKGFSYFIFPAGFAVAHAEWSATSS